MLRVLPLYDYQDYQQQIQLSNKRVIATYTWNERESAYNVLAALSDGTIVIDNKFIRPNETLYFNFDSVANKNFCYLYLIPKVAGFTPSMANWSENYILSIVTQE